MGWKFDFRLSYVSEKGAKAKRLALVVLLAGAAVTSVFYFGTDIVRVKFLGYEMVRHDPKPPEEQLPKEVRGIAVAPKGKNILGVDRAEAKPSAVDEPVSNKETVVSTVVPRPRPKFEDKKEANDFGYYLEQYRAQGDVLAYETYKLEPRCVPPFQMPLVCYLEQKSRLLTPVVKEH